MATLCGRALVEPLPIEELDVYDELIEQREELIKDLMLVALVESDLI